MVSEAPPPELRQSQRHDPEGIKAPDSINLLIPSGSIASELQKRRYRFANHPIFSLSVSRYSVRRLKKPPSSILHFSNCRKKAQRARKLRVLGWPLPSNQLSLAIFALSCGFHDTVVFAWVTFSMCAGAAPDGNYIYRKHRRWQRENLDIPATRIQT